MDKCAIYIDGGYMQKLLRKNGLRLDYAKFVSLLAGNMPVLRAYYYTCMPYAGRPPSEDEQRRLDKMESYVHGLRMVPGMEVKLGWLQKIRQPGDQSPLFRQKGVDIMLGVDLARMSWSGQIGTAVVVTADSDFVYAVKSAKDAGVRTRLCHYGGGGWHVNRRLIEEVDEIARITDEMLRGCAKE